MKKEKHTIWSNIKLDLKDWMDGLRGNEEINNRNPDSFSEDYYRNQMHELNNSYLDDERMSLDIELGRPIIAFADFGLWNGRRTGYRMIKSGNIKDCLYDNVCDYCEWYVDEKGEMRFTGHHHDGSNYYFYRVLKPDTTDEQCDELTNALCYGKDASKHIKKYTDRIGDYIGDVYGWKFRNRRKTACFFA